MKTKLLLGLALGAASLVPVSGANSDLRGTRDVLEQWVETKQMISKEKNDWTPGAIDPC